MLSKVLLRSTMQKQMVFTQSQRSIAVTAALVKKLRDATGAPMMECKKALTNVIAEDANITENDCMAAANEYLRKRGSLLAASKAGRSAKEGVVVYAIDASKKQGTIIEINCETDFVARNGTFMAFALRSALASLGNTSVAGTVDPTGNSKNIDVPELVGTVLPVGPAAMNSADAPPNTIAAELVDVVTNCRENVRFRRAVSVNVGSAEGFIAGYVHNELPIPDEIREYLESVQASGVTVGLGGAAALAAFETAAAPSASLIDLGRKVAMQAVAAKPAYLARENVPESIVDKEKEIILAASNAGDKDEKIVANLVRGKMNKFYEAAVLLDQNFLITNDTKKPKVAELIAEIDGTAKVTQFARLQRGEDLVEEETQE